MRNSFLWMLSAFGSAVAIIAGAQLSLAQRAAQTGDEPTRADDTTPLPLAA